MMMDAMSVRARGLWRSLFPTVAISFLMLAVGRNASPQDAGPPEVQVRGATPKFRVRAERNLVMVRVVVRDAKGRAVAGLRKEDFRLLDDGTPQEIASFSIEAGDLKTAGTEAGATPVAAAGNATPTPAPLAPVASPRFLVLFFDDLHIDGEGMTRTRDAAWRYLSSAGRPQDRVAILTSSGMHQLGFTDDGAKLHETLFCLAPHSRTAAPGRYPEIGEYQAYLIDQAHDHDATEIAFAEATQHICCQPGGTQEDAPTTDGSPHAGESPFAGHCELAAHQMALGEAADVWSAARIQSENSLQKINSAVGRLAAMPGQRSLVLVSTGFLTETREAEMDAIINRALLQGVVVSALEAASLDAHVPHRLMIPSRPDLDAQKTVLEHTALTQARDALASLATGTGGLFFHDSDDLEDGFRQVATDPRVCYVLSFSPDNLKLNGKFHSLKLTLNNHESYIVQARRGYFASGTALAEQAPGANELQQVVFSLEEHHQLPAQVTTKVEKLNDHSSTLTVSIHVDVASLHYRKEADRSVNTLIFDTALFDRDGKYLASKEASLELHLKDGSVERFSKSGINAQTSFKVAPGAYRVREVVRDSETTGMSALNCDAQVPGASR